MSDREDLNLEIHEEDPFDLTGLNFDEDVPVDVSDVTLDENLSLDLEHMSLEELLESTREDLARVDALMGAGTDVPDVTLFEEEEEGKMPSFIPTYQEEYADLEPEEALPEEEYVPKPERKHLLAPGLRTLIYVCTVLAASMLLAVGAWLCADDVLALTKPDRETSVIIAQNDTIADVTEQLEEKGLIKYGWLFKFYCWYSHAEEKIEAGTYTLNNLYDYHALVNGMRAGAVERATVQITIPEGYECDDIFSELAAQGVCSLEELEQAAARHEFEYDFLQDLPYGDVKRLEGYLFPDTYQFFVGDNAVNVIDKFLRNFDKKLTDELRAAVDEVNAMLETQMAANGFTAAEIAETKLTLHDIIIVASLIEKETGRTSESASIASVIYNRLCSKLYPCLQIDATIQYVLPERKEILSNADKAFLSPYNTYINAGLPAGPIANPGINSIRAALYPADTDYYFYALNKDGAHTFSETYYEHQEVLEEMERD